MHADFFTIKANHAKKERVIIYPVFEVKKTQDLMVRGKEFYAVWDAENNIWSKDEYKIQEIVDKALAEHKRQLEKNSESTVIVKWMRDFSTNILSDFRRYIGALADNAVELDSNITFADSKITKESYASKRVPYSLVNGSIESYEELISVLYDSNERQKLEWAIGAVLAGEAKTIQKFIVLYGEGGTGKSTILNIIQKLFEGYYTIFDAKSLTNNDPFASATFRNNALVAIQHDGDLSKIEDNSKLNSIISHEDIIINEKFKRPYVKKAEAMLFLGTNSPVKITDAKSGIIRRLIGVKPTGNLIPIKRYAKLYTQIDFELGAIANHCLLVYKQLGKNYYANYKALDMMVQTNVFYNFITDNIDELLSEEGVTLKRAYDLYLRYCEETSLEFKMPRYKFKHELNNYYKEFHDRIKIAQVSYRSLYRGFKMDKVNNSQGAVIQTLIKEALTLSETSSILDALLKDCPAQYANNKETPISSWDKVTTTLEELNTKQLHYVKPPENHIVIDFDLKDENGDKCLELNLEAAAKMPLTYAESSKSGEGIHLHYIYEGDATKLSRVFSEGIEIKVFSGNASLRRKRIINNGHPVTTINSGLPLKGEKMVNFDIVKNEQGIRALVKKNLRKEVHPGTKPSIDFIHKILEDAYNEGVPYDLTDMRPKIMAFANNSTNQAEYCLKLVAEMKFKSEVESEDVSKYNNDELVFFDVEVFPNLFIVVWKIAGEGRQPVKMINPSPEQIGQLLEMKLVGFNNRRYDNHILYARYMGYTLEQIYNLSQRIINGSPNAMFMEAYNLSYTDIYCFSSKKQSLKKFEIELGIHHCELGLPWDQPVPEEKWQEAVDYCVYDVLATEATFNARKSDYDARLILSKLSGLTPNQTTQKHTSKILFKGDRKPQDKFEYTDLSEMFPGYKYEFGKSTYRGEEVSEGGYVYSVPGMYSDVGLLDITSMHPNSLIQLNAFGPYTQNFKEIVDARVAIKNKDFDKAGEMLGGILKEFLQDETATADLAYALKIVINIVYGMTSAKFENDFKDPRNVDNIVAKRGALFMVDLKHALLEKGWTLLHIKTDSIKLANITEEMITFVHEFGKKYGYNFEHEATYSKLCIVNDAVYIAQDSSDKHWSATGAQFQHPYVYKTLFSKEPLDIQDLTETKSVKTALYLDMNEDLPEDEHDYKFVGKVGAFIPIKAGCGGGELLREKDGKYHAATGTKGYRWMEAEKFAVLNNWGLIDMQYFKDLADAAVINISQYGDFEWFTTDDVPF